MKSPQRSHHVCVVGPAGWKRWPRPRTGCLAGWRAVPGEMRTALARSRRVRPGPARRAGARSRSSMSSGSDMARSAGLGPALGASDRSRGGRAPGRAPTQRRPGDPGGAETQAERRERARGAAPGEHGPRAAWTRRRSGAGLGGTAGHPLQLLALPAPQSNSPPRDEACKRPHGHACFWRPALQSERKRVPTSGPRPRPRPSLPAGWGRKRGALGWGDGPQAACSPHPGGRALAEPRLRSRGQARLWLVAWPWGALSSCASLPSATLGDRDARLSVLLPVLDLALPAGRWAREEAEWGVWRGGRGPRPRVPSPATIPLVLAARAAFGGLCAAVGTAGPFRSHRLQHIQPVGLSPPGRSVRRPGWPGGGGHRSTPTPSMPLRPSHLPPCSPPLRLQPEVLLRGAEHVLQLVLGYSPPLAFVLSLQPLPDFGDLGGEVGSGREGQAAGGGPELVLAVPTCSNTRSFLGGWGSARARWARKPCRSARWGSWSIRVSVRKARSCRGQGRPV